MTCASVLAVTTLRSSFSMCFFLAYNKFVSPLFVLLIAHWRFISGALGLRVWVFIQRVMSLIPSHVCVQFVLLTDWYLYLYQRWIFFKCEEYWPPLPAHGSETLSACRSPYDPPVIASICLALAGSCQGFQHARHLEASDRQQTNLIYVHVFWNVLYSLIGCDECFGEMFCHPE
jgi:hypothetical protein